MLPLHMIAGIEPVQTFHHLAMQGEGIGIGHRTIADSQSALFRYHVERNTALNSSKIEHIIGRVRKDRLELGAWSQATLVLDLPDRINCLGHHRDRIHAGGRIAAVAAAPAHRYLEQDDTLVCVSYLPGSWLTNPGKARDR